MGSQPTSSARRSNLRTRAGFTLAELIVASTVSALVIAGVVATMVVLARSNARLRDKYEIAAQTRDFLSTLSRDLYSATAVTWNSAASLKITIPAGSAGYVYDSTARTITYTPPTGGSQVLMTGVDTLTFSAYDIAGTSLSLASNLADASTKTRFLGLSGTVIRGKPGAVRTREALASPRYTIRNHS